LLRSESLDEDPLVDDAARLGVRRDAAVLPDDPARPRVEPDDRLEPEARLDPEDRLEPADRLEPEDRLEPADRLEPEDPLEPEDLLARVDLLAAALREPPPLLALLPAVFRLVCFRELLVVATTSPLSRTNEPLPLVGVG
jgi:hypothetical protein